MVRTRVKEIRETGRNTMGVKLIDLRNGEKAPGNRTCSKSGGRRGSANRRPNRRKIVT